MLKFLFVPFLESHNHIEGVNPREAWTFCVLDSESIDAPFLKAQLRKLGRAPLLLTQRRR